MPPEKRFGVSERPKLLVSVSDHLLVYRVPSGMAAPTGSGERKEREGRGGGQEVKGIWGTPPQPAQRASFWGTA